MKKHLYMAAFLVVAIIADMNYATARTSVHTYKAKLSTASSSYQGKVDVAGGEVTTIYWPDGSQKDVEEAELSHGSTVAEIPDFGWVRVEINDPSYSASDEEYVDDDSSGE
jgi:hypothetical protein